MGVEQSKTGQSQWHIKRPDKPATTTTSNATLFHYYEFDVPTLKYASSLSYHADNPLQRLRDNVRLFGGAILKVVCDVAGEPNDEMYRPLKLTIEGDVVRPEAPTTSLMDPIGQEGQITKQEEPKQEQLDVKHKEKVTKAKAQPTPPVEIGVDGKKQLQKLLRSSNSAKNYFNTRVDQAVNTELNRLKASVRATANAEAKARQKAVVDKLRRELQNVMARLPNQQMAPSSSGPPTAPKGYVAYLTAELQDVKQQLRSYQATGVDVLKKQLDDVMGEFKNHKAKYYQEHNEHAQQLAQRLSSKEGDDLRKKMKDVTEQFKDYREMSQQELAVKNQKIAIISARSGDQDVQALDDAEVVRRLIANEGVSCAFKSLCLESLTQYKRVVKSQYKEKLDEIELESRNWLKKNATIPDGLTIENLEKFFSILDGGRRLEAQLPDITQPRLTGMIFTDIVRAQRQRMEEKETPRLNELIREKRKRGEDDDGDQACRCIHRY